MKNILLSFYIICIFFFECYYIFSFTSIGFAQKKQQYDSIPKRETTVFKFKVAGLLSQPDADNIEALLYKSPEVIYAYINMKDGICSVEAGLNSNSKVFLNRITTLCNQKGEKFKAELLPPIEKEKLN